MDNNLLLSILDTSVILVRDSIIRSDKGDIVVIPTKNNIDLKVENCV